MSDTSFRSSKERRKQLKAKRKAKKDKVSAEAEPQKPKEKPLTQREVFGADNLFDEYEGGRNAPSYMGCTIVKSFMRRGKYWYPAHMRSIGNIEDLWHGTSIASLCGIARKGLIVKGSYGLFGAGIYFSPDLNKAMAHAKGGVTAGGVGRYRHKALLKCAVAMGRSFHTDRNGDHFTFLKERGYHSLRAFAGTLYGAYGGSLRNAEYVVYHGTQVQVQEIHIYREDEDFYHSTFPWRRSRTPVIPASVKAHPCKRKGAVCKSAYGESGCIITNRKKGCTDEDAEYCPKFG